MRTTIVSVAVASILFAIPNSCIPERDGSARVETRKLPGKDETCMECHSNYTGFVPAHDPNSIGCSSCHLGNPFEKDEKKSHEGMVLVPGNLSNARRTCGISGCHPDIPHRVENSLMTSMAGVITVNRFAFGESNTLSFWTHVKDLKDNKAADVHLRNLCASCHLGAEKERAARISEKSRGGGCIACHLNYSHVPMGHDLRDTTNKIRIHPAIDLKVTNEHCFGCHSRSGRISTNYEGWHETLHDPDVYQNKTGFRILQDRRVMQYISPDVHHIAGLSCIDCHSSNEIMGDGTRYLHSNEAVKVQCQDCHFTGKPETVKLKGLDEESAKILRQRNLNLSNPDFIKSKSSGILSYNLILDKEQKPKMVGKNTGKLHELKAPAPVCTKGKAHDALTCSACHTAWAPQCIGCHNSYDSKKKGYDLLAKKSTKGKWEEYLGGFFAEAPTLGVVEKNGIRHIKPFIPGMIMTIDKSGFPGEKNTPEIFRRLFAPVSPHTTTTKGRSCTSCHNDPNALGFGRGKLIYSGSGKTGQWKFYPEYESLPQDGLPQDSWTGFLQFPKGVSTTRPNARPFFVEEQKKILAAGACLTCHDGNSLVMQNALIDFEKVLKTVSDKCVVPRW